MIGPPHSEEDRPVHVVPRGSLLHGRSSSQSVAWFRDLGRIFFPGLSSLLQKNMYETDDALEQKVRSLLLEKHRKQMLALKDDPEDYRLVASALEEKTKVRLVRQFLLAAAIT